MKKTAHLGAIANERGREAQVGKSFGQDRPYGFISK
jgi:hypothetical protein